MESGYAFNDDLSVFMGLELQRNSDWTLWRGDNRLGTYRAEQILLNAGTVYLMGSRQELRVRLEALGLNAEAKRGWRVAADGKLVHSNDRLDDFALRNLECQVRYRYEFAPLSYLYLTYVRGGSLFNAGKESYSNGESFGSAFVLRESEQLFVKLSYRFKL